MSDQIVNEAAFQAAIDSLGPHDDVFSQWYLDEGNLRAFVARYLIAHQEQHDAGVAVSAHHFIGTKFLGTDQYRRPQQEQRGNEEARLRHLLTRAVGIIGRARWAKEDEVGAQVVTNDALSALNQETGGVPC